MRRTIEQFAVGVTCRKRIKTEEQNACVTGSAILSFSTCPLCEKNRLLTSEKLRRLAYSVLSLQNSFSQTREPVVLWADFRV
ncbi:hypothetical protein CEXT_79811 [Caerostris extrusa]|uniref:Uncharacterized protein n=1 Tax=Caerostris extrusa TaxID=172846 RepID=A0AAV4T8N3_CAEEX|nr:hypothetical protein CEXT_79811 [Caerostris extrusa]